MGKIKKRAGFTLIEVIVAMAILLIIVVSVLMLATVSASSLKDSEARDMAKNIATYTVEYLRSRNVTSDNNFIPTSSWYPASEDYPGIVDLGNTPLQINANPALPNQTYADKPGAFYSSLQGYVSLANSPADLTPSNEDGNAKVIGGKYYDLTTGAPYVVRFPLVSDLDPDPIKNFTALTDYNALIYTTDKPTDTNSKTNPSSPEYDPHYTNDATGTMAYRGFRVLTQIAARTKDSSYTHVQYYDVKVTVFWIIGNKEHSYSLATQITTYGGS